MRQLRSPLVAVVLAAAMFYAPTVKAVSPVAPVTRVDRFAGSGVVLSAVALNAAAATRTMTITGLAALYSGLILEIDYTYSAATTVTVTATCSRTGETTDYVSLTSNSTASGTRTHYILSDTYTTGGASADIQMGWDITGCKLVKLVLGGASAGAGDLVTTRVFGVVGI